MSPEESDSDRTQISPPGSGPRPDDRDLGFEPTRYGASAAPTVPAGDVPADDVPAAADLGNGLPMGTRLGEFELTRLVGEGGFGIVYMATDHSLQRRVALKEYMPSSLAARSGASQVQVKSERYRETFEAGRKSFINEARLLAQFDHPSLVKVYRFWEANGTAYLVMPFYEGQTLREVLRGAAVAPDEAWLRTLLQPLTEALMVIHAEQCYHRDIAPDNVMMLAGSNRPLLLDFGAARRVIGDMTQALTVILKPGYAPVEQYAETPGMKQGPWTDVYALAAVVHCAITGRTPPPAVGRLLNDTYQPLTQVAVGRFSEGFLAAVDRALAVRPEQRTQTIAQLRQEMGLDDGSAPPRVPTNLALPPTGAAQPAPPVATGPSPAPPASAPSPAAAAGFGGQGGEGRKEGMEGQGSKGGQGSKVALVGAGLGLLVLAGVGLVVWRPGAGPGPAPAPAAAVAPALAPTVVPPAPTPPPPTVARFEPDREIDRIVQAQTAGFGVRAEPLKTRLSVAKSDEFRFRVTADRDGFLYVLGYGADGGLSLLVPNKTSPEVRLSQGRTWAFPDNKSFMVGASEPLGPTRLLVLVSTHPRSFDALKPKFVDPYHELASGAEAAALAARFQGTNSILAGQPQCPAGSGCADAYGAAVMSFETVR